MKFVARIRTVIDCSAKLGRRRLRRGRRPLRRGDAKHLHRLGDVLELALAQILEQDLGRAVDEIAHRARDVDRARLGDVLEPRRHVHAVALDVAVLDHDVAEIDADAEFDALPLGDVGVARRHAVLHVDRAAHRLTGLANSARTPSPVVLTRRP
jgi:hypothetical protein